MRAETPRAPGGGGERDGARRPRLRAEAIAIVIAAASAGLASTILEFDAVRMLAPVFGQSSAVWAADIGVILLALAGGYALGGVVADRTRRKWRGASLAGTMGSALVLLCYTANMGPYVLQRLAPSGAAEAGSHSSALWGSIFGCAVLFGPSTLFLGMVPPFLVRCRTRSGRVGRAAGFVSAAGTVGALVGCYAAPLWLLPRWGTRTTCFVAAGFIALVIPALFFLGRDWDSARVTAPASLAAPTKRALHFGHLAAAALAGFVVMAIEFAGVRVLAPWFGQSNGIWANAVGVILLALALGAAIGGRIADRAASARPLYVALAVAAIWLAVAGRAAAPFAAWLAPSDLASDGGLSMAFWGSLAANAACFAPPALLLGMAGPILVRQESRPGREGRAAGLVFAWGTLGSLAGCGAAPLLLVPALGSRGVCFLSASVLAALAAVALWKGGRRLAWWMAVPAAAISLALWVGSSGPLRIDPGQIAEIETAYQTVRVVERVEESPVPVEGKGPFEWGTRPVRTRNLRFDEDYGSYQSVFLPDDSKTLLTAGRYYDHLALGAWFAGMPWSASPARAPEVLIVGYAGGTLHRVLRDVAPAGLEPRVLGVEIDPGVVDFARRHLGLNDVVADSTTLVTGEDGRTVVNGLPAGRLFDLIFVDAYQRTQYIPFQVATVEFFRECLAHLAPNGALGVNVLANGVYGRVPRSIAATMAEAVGRAGSVSLVPNTLYAGSVAIWMKRGAPPRVAGGASAKLAVPAATLDRLLVRHVPGIDEGLVLTDDLAPTENLTDEMLLGAEDR